MLVTAISQSAMASINDDHLQVNVYHDGRDSVELCSTYNNEKFDCDDFDLTGEKNPFVYSMNVGIPQEGDDFTICYDIKERDEIDCDDYELTGKTSDFINLVLPGGTSPRNDGVTTIYNNDGNSEEIDNGSNLNGFAIQDPVNPTQEETLDSSSAEVSWITFNDDNGLFTMQYPSNWNPTKLKEFDPVGPIDILFVYEDSESRNAMLHLVQYSDKSIYSTPKEIADAEVNVSKNDSEFILDKQVECGNVKLDGLDTCDYNYLLENPPGNSGKALNVFAVDANGKEYNVNFTTEPELFDYFYPVVKYMIESFRTTTFTNQSQQ